MYEPPKNSLKEKSNEAVLWEQEDGKEVSKGSSSSKLSLSGKLRAHTNTNQRAAHNPKLELSRSKKCRGSLGDLQVASKC